MLCTILSIDVKGRTTYDLFCNPQLHTYINEGKTLLIVGVTGNTYQYLVEDIESIKTFVKEWEELSSYNLLDY